MHFLFPIPSFRMLCDRERGDSVLWERGSSESVKVGRAELEAAPALEFGGLKLLLWHQPSLAESPKRSQEGQS